MNNTAFSSISSNVIKDISLYDLGQVTKGTNKTYKVKAPAPANTGVPTTQKCNIFLSGFVNSMEGTNQVLTIQMKNLTSGSGEIKESAIPAATVGNFYTTVSLECFQDDVIEFTFIYFATEAGTKATFTAFATVAIA